MDSLYFYKYMYNIIKIDILNDYFIEYTYYYSQNTN